ncbi:MAG: hypothetical protein Q8Q85_15425 [Gemmatimonadales bacterium]|nr:hypothetical protein [Gemmatimonadales bacterium]
MKLTALTTAALIGAAGCAVPHGLAAQQTDEAVVPVVGEAAIRGDSLLAANTAARTAGYREALRIQLGRLLDSLGAVQAFPQLQSRARAYVRREEVDNEEREGNVMRVSLRVTLDVARLKTDLEALGYEIRTIGAEAQSVMVVIDEYYVNNPRSLSAQAQAQAPPPSAMTGRAAAIPDSAFDPFTRPEFREPGARVSAAGLEEALNRNQFTVLDQGSVQQLRADLPGLTADIVKQGDRLADFARRANERFHAQVVIVGATTIINTGRDPSGLETRRAMMTYRAIDASTGRLLASGTVESAAQASDPLIARQRAATRVSEIAAERLIPQLTRAARTAASRGELYIVELVGFSGFAQARAFLQAVQGTEDVTSARQTLLDLANHRIRIEVMFTRTREDLMGEVFDAAREIPGFGTLDLRNQRGNELVFAVRQ